MDYCQPPFDILRSGVSVMLKDGFGVLVSDDGFDNLGIGRRIQDTGNHIMPEQVVCDVFDKAPTF